MDKKTLRQTLQNYGRALADNMLPLTFIVGEDVEFGREDILNNTEPGNMLRDILSEGAGRTFGIEDPNQVTDLLIVYYLMLNTSILVEHSTHSHKGGKYQPDVDRGVFTLDEEEIEDMFKSHGVETPEKVYKDLKRVSDSIGQHYTLNEIKGIRLEHSKAKAVNPRSLMVFDNGVHVVPVDVIVGYIEGLREHAKTGILKITYKRVNQVDRTQYVTINKDVINDVYKEDLNFADMFFQVSNPKAYPYHDSWAYGETYGGFWKVGDLGLSRFEHQASRQISISRITEVKLATRKEYEGLKKYVNIDLEGVEEAFSYYICKLEEEQVKQVKNHINCPETIDILNFINSQISIFTTTYRKQLHDYMVMNQEHFAGYTGIKTDIYGQSKQFSGRDIAFGQTEHMDF
ncbi:hypothetical protein P9X10_00525 [Bacillus cereus]|nr:hypothetical protein [Bacillus cereus]